MISFTGMGWSACMSTTWLLLRQFFKAYWKKTIEENAGKFHSPASHLIVNILLNALHYNHIAMGSNSEKKANRACILPQLNCGVKFVVSTRIAVECSRNSESTPILFQFYKLLQLCWPRCVCADGPWYWFVLNRSLCQCRSLKTAQKRPMVQHVGRVV